MGPPVVPLTKADLTNDSVAKPPKLFSHSHQAAYWQAMAPEGAQGGWGGRLADLLMHQNSVLATFNAITPAGNAVWLAARTVREYDVATTGATPLGSDGTILGSAAIHDAVRATMSTQDGAHVMQDDVADVFKRSIRASSAMQGALPPLTTPQASDPLLSYTNPADGKPAVTRWRSNCMRSAGSFRRSRR